MFDLKIKYRGSNALLVQIALLFAHRFLNIAPVRATAGVSALLLFTFLTLLVGAPPSSAINRPLEHAQFRPIEIYIVLVVDDRVDAESAIVALGRLDEELAVPLRAYGAVEDTVDNTAAGVRALRLIGQIALVKVDQLAELKRGLVTVEFDLLVGKCVPFGRF
jgi:hypothetical protein